VRSLDAPELRALCGGLPIERFGATFDKSASSSDKTLLRCVQQRRGRRQPGASTNRRESAMSHPSERHMQVCHWNGSECHHFDAPAWDYSKSTWANEAARLQAEADANRLRAEADLKPDTCASVAEDFQAAAELLTEVEAPSEYEVEALASAQDDLRSEADYLANVDPSEIGSPAVVGRYLSASRASRRHAVIRYMTTARMGNPSPQLRRVLDIIGGEGF
jgi:hypothetical protein